MKNILLIAICFISVIGCQQTTENSTSEFSEVRLDFTSNRTYVYEATHRMMTQGLKTELKGTLKIIFKEDELADLKFEFTDNKSELPILGEVEFPDTTILVSDMNSKGVFINGIEPSEMLIEALIPLTLSEKSEILLKIPMSQKFSEESEPFEMKMTFQKTKTDSLAHELMFEGRFNESKTYEQPFKYKIEVTGMGEYVYNEEDLRYDYVSVRMNVFNEFIESGITGLVNYSTILKYQGTE